jgi:hypothetical protein
LGLYGDCTGAPTIYEVDINIYVHGQQYKPILQTVKTGRCALACPVYKIGIEDCILYPDSWYTLDVKIKVSLFEQSVCAYNQQNEKKNATMTIFPFLFRAMPLTVAKMV